MIQVITDGEVAQCGSSASIFKRNHEVVAALKSRRNVEYTLAHHSGGVVAAATFDFQTVIAFEFICADSAQISNGVTLLADLIKVPRELAILTEYGRTTQVLFHLKTPIKKRSYFDERRGWYLEVCQRWLARMRAVGIVAEVNLDLFRADATLPLPGTVYRGKAVELSQYSDAMIDLEPPVRRSPADHILPHARAALMIWTTEHIERTDDPADYVPSNEAYNAFTEWHLTHPTRGNHQISKVAFGKAMSALYPAPRKEKNRCINGRQTNCFSRVRMRPSST